MKPERRQIDIDRVEWRIGMQAWEMRAPRWLPELDFAESPLAALAAVLFILGVGSGGAVVAAGPVGCGLASFFLASSALVTLVGLVPRTATIRGPELVLGIGPTHLEIGADWPYVPADRLTATLAGMGWKEAGGRRIPWAEIKGARLGKGKQHLEMMLSTGEVVRLPVAGSRRWDKTLATVARELDDHCRRVEGGRAPRALDALRARD